ncbi:hypothetical protein BMS3Abin14_00482 [bacterium BMS3Abin14]|nr:hypothetical protein BMS3Abin14_00482 [bacterium BMS3Abin14]
MSGVEDKFELAEKIRCAMETEEVMSMNEPGTFDIEPVDEIRIYELMGDYAGVQGSRIEDKNGHVILNPSGNYDLSGPEHSFCGAHAFSSYIKITKDGRSRCLLFDVGQNETALEQNIKAFSALDREFDPQKMEMILLSHGHSDHYYNLNRTLEIVNPGAKREIPIYVGGESFFRPRTKVSGEDFLDAGEYIVLTPDRQGAEKRGGKWIISQRPTLVMDNMVLYLGSIRPEARKMGIAKDYEMTPRPWPRFFECDKNGNVVSRDLQDTADEDTSIVFNVRNKGLVVISGCSHAGVNTSVAYAKAITGSDSVHCYYGGFHPNSDVDATARDLRSQNIRYIIPTHCSPWALVNLLWQENRKSNRPFMLTKNHLSPVGSVYTFSSLHED